MPDWITLPFPSKLKIWIANPTEFWAHSPPPFLFHFVSYIINEKLLQLLLLLLLLHVVNVKIIFFQKKTLKENRFVEKDCIYRFVIIVVANYMTKIDNEEISFLFYLLLLIVYKFYQLNTDPKFGDKGTKNLYVISGLCKVFLFSRQNWEID